MKLNIQKQSTVVTRYIKVEHNCTLFEQKHKIIYVVDDQFCFLHGKLFCPYRELLTGSKINLVQPTI